MKPEVLAWALLFVIAVGVLYRFGVWMSHRQIRDQRQTVPDKPPAIPTGAPPPADIVSPIISAAPVRAEPAPDVREAAIENGALLRGEASSAITKRRSVMLPSRKVSGNAPIFGLRIQKAGTRKISVVSEATRKARSAVADQRRPRTTVRKALQKPAARRIGISAETDNGLVSTKATTRIVGVPRRSSRIPVSTTA